MHCRRQADLEARLIEEETERCVGEAVEARVKEVMASQAVQQSLQERLVRERKLLEEQVCIGCSLLHALVCELTQFGCVTALSAIFADFCLLRPASTQSPT